MIINMMNRSKIPSREEVIKALISLGLSEDELKLLEILSYEKNVRIGLPPIDFKIVVNR